MAPGIKIKNAIKTILVCIFIILSAALSGCTTEEGSSEKEEQEESGLLLPPEFNSSVNYNYTFNRWNLKVNYTDYGYLTNYTEAFARLITNSESRKYAEVSEIEYEVIFEEPRDEFGNKIHQYYSKFERSNSMVFQYFTGDELVNETIIDDSLYNELKPNIYETTSNPINDGLDLDYYPPRINTSFYYVNATNTGSTGEVILKNYGKHSDVIAQVTFEYFTETIQNNVTVRVLKTGSFRLVFNMDSSEVVRVTAHLPPDVKTPPLVYLDDYETRYPTDDITTYSIFQQWDVRYAGTDDTSYGDMTLERL